MKKKRRIARESRKEAVQKERQGRTRALLVKFGLWDELTKLGLKDVLLRAYNPKFEFSVSEEIPADEHIQNLLRDLIAAAQRATFNCPLLGDEYPIVDYLIYVHPLATTLCRIQIENLSRELQLKLERIKPLVEIDTSLNAFDEMYYQNLHRVVAGYGKIDNYLYRISWTADQTPHGRLKHRLVINRVKPEQRVVKKDMELRTAYRCGIPMLNDVDWTEWPSTALGEKNDDRKYPVFIQRHVFERLYDRAGQIFYGEGFEAAMQYHLALALWDPKIHPRDDGSLLVEFHMGKYKLGYLVARKMDDLILVETFLFLTMDGTPEGNQLWKQLRLRRADKQLQGLDKLGTFVCTDVALDPALVELFTKCGCGHLFQMRTDLSVDQFVAGYAADIRKYLRLKPDRSLDIIRNVSK